MRQKMGNIKFVLLLLVALQFVRWCACQNSTVDFDVVEINKSGNATLACNVTSAGNLTRWTYLSGSTETILMSFQNGLCTVSPSNSFLSDSRFSYTCNSTVYQVIILPYAEGGRNINNNILACRDALQPDMTDSTWIIKINLDNAIACSYCQPKVTFNVLEVTEGNNLTFVCRVPFEVAFTNWNLNFGSRTDAIGVSMNQCATASNAITFLGNTSEYIYTCNKTVYQVTRLNVQRSEHYDMYMCTPASWLEGTGSNWIITVKAPVTSVVMTPSKYLINVTENTTQRFTCTTSTARPAASVYWYRHTNGNNNDVTQITKNVTTTTDYNDLSVTTSILRFFSMRQHNNMKIFCKANNSLNTIQVSSDGKRLLNVLYKADDPYINVSNEYRVIEDSQGTLSCSAKGGNPTPTLSWSCNNFSPSNQPTISSNGSVTSTLTWTALRNHNGMCTCTSQQTGFQDKKIYISLVVLYPPSKPVFKVNGSNVVGDIHFVEGKSRSINCTADSKPSPDRYTWTGPIIDNPVNKDTLIFNEIKKTDAGQYNCSVHNTMKPSSGGSVAGTNNTVVKVIVLHPPQVEAMNNVSILKGEQLNLTCNFTAGMPNDTSIKWTRDVDNNRWNTANLNIMSLKKNDTGEYTCTAVNTMIQSGDNISYTGQHNQSFYLDVVYASSITSFTIFGSDGHTKTVNENDPVKFVCQADSNPAGIMTLSRRSENLNSLTSNILEYNLVNASCLEAGIYYCSSRNRYNGDNDVNATVQLFVNCHPRIQYVVDRNITSEINETITIALNVIAYPPPNFTWYQLVDENWTLLNDGDNYGINSSIIQSTLTIHSVGRDDFTSYRVNVTNDLGTIEQFYFLTPYDKPDPPSQLRHIEDYATMSSIHLEWKPGFDNGPSQTFYVMYRKSSDSRWNYLIVADNGEQTMELTLTELTEDTQYYIVIFASNEIGNSSHSQVLVARTQAIDKPPLPGALIGGIAGGVAGCIILVIVIIVIIRRYPVFKRKGANEAGIRRSVSDDSDEDDDKVQKGKTSTGKNTSKGVDVYENVELANKPAKNDGSKQLPPKDESNRVPKLKVVNKDRLIYADLVFNDKPPGEKMVINGDDPTPYALVDFTKKAEPLQ